MAQHALKLVLLGLGLLAQQPGAMRLQMAEEPGEVLGRVNKLFKGGSGTVCGGKQIREILSADASIQRIRNLPWSKVLAIADGFIQSQTHRVSVLQVELQGLRKAAADAALAEMPAELSVEQINAAVTAAVADPSSYISLELAQETGCGGTRPKDKGTKLPRGGYEKAEELFQASVQSLLGSGQLRVDGARLHDTCNELLSPGAEASDLSFCQELCHSFADAAQKISDSTVGGNAGGESAADLQRQADEKENQLRYAAAELGECTTAKSDLESFRAQLQGLQANIETEFKTVRGARGALNEAQQDLDELGEDVEDQEKAVLALTEAVKSLGDKVQAAEQQLETLTTQNSGLKDAIKQGEAHLAEASMQVKKAGDAAAAAQSLKAQLSALLMKLSMFFDAALRRPLRDMGLSEGAGSFFPQNLDDVAGMQDANQALTALRAYCDDKGTLAKLAAFDVDSGETPATSLCDFGALPEVQKEIVDSVKFHIGKLEVALDGLRSWLNPFKGDDAMTKEKAAELVQQGEPQGLREMVAVLQDTNFFKGYLQHWKVSEKFHVLFGRVGKALAESEAQQSKFTQEVADLQVKLAEGLKAQQAAAEALQQAIAASDAEKANLEVAEAELKALKDQQKAMEDKLAKLKQALADAQARYEAAKATLSETHRQGTAFLEVLRHLEAAVAEHGVAVAKLHLKMRQ